MDALLIPVFVLCTVLVPVVALALLLYAIPVRASVTLVRNEAGQAHSQVISWAGLGIRISGSGACLVTEVLIGEHPVLIHTGSIGSPAMESMQESAGKTAPEQAATPGDILPSGRLLNAGTIIDRVLRLTGPVVSFGSVFRRSCRFVDARGKVILGLGDPVLTGEVCGMYWASRYLLQASRVYLELEPVFDREMFGLDITVRLRVNHPLLVLVAVVRLAQNPGLRDAVDVVRRQRTGAAAL